MRFSFDSTVLNGLPVHVIADVSAASGGFTGSLYEPATPFEPQEAVIQDICWPAYFSKKQGKLVARKIPSKVLQRITPDEFARLEREAIQHA